MKGLIVALGLIASLPAAAGVSAQGLPGGRPSDAIDHARALAIQPFTTLPIPPQPTERYVPQRRIFSPELGREVVVPGHFERDVNGQRVAVPPLTITGPTGDNPVVVPGGERPPVEQRQGP